jgi:hypothetical protein
MRLPGHSGCSFTFNDEQGLVVKSTKGSNYPTDRFERQINKQKKFCEEHIGEHLHKAPHVFGTYIEDGHISATMELVDGLDPIEFLLNASGTQLLEFFTIVTELINNYLNQSQYEEVSLEILMDKFESVCDNIDETDKTLLTALWVEKYMPQGINHLMIPVGPCHGDLTLSNMIIRQDNIVVFDFIETYLDSPLQDIVKLRQDTEFGWTLHRYPNSLTNKEVANVFSRLHAFDNYLQLVYPMDQWYYETFQFLNLVRILPYCKDQKTKDWVMDSIRML